MFKVGDIVKGIRGWSGYGEGVVLETSKMHENHHWYKIKFFDKGIYTPVIDLGLEFVREPTPLEKAML